MSDDPREDQPVEQAGEDVDIDGVEEGSRLDELPSIEQTVTIAQPTGEVVERRHPSKAISMAFWCLSSF